MIELQKEFEGTGEVKGDHFTQIKQSKFAFIYARTDGEGIVGYEVFKRRESKETDVILNGKTVHYEPRVLYPKSEAFGLWAKAPRTLGRALEIFEMYNEEGLKNEKQ